MSIRLTAGLVICISAIAPACADSYPVTGKWGVSSSTDKGPIDCGKLRVLSFNGDQRTDSGGGVPAFRNRSVTAAGGGQYRVEDVFTTGQISNAHVDYTLHQIDGDHLELNMEKGGLLKLRKCK
jgi:hypothetical protein